MCLLVVFLVLLSLTEGDPLRVILYNPYTNAALSWDTSSGADPVLKIGPSYPSVWFWDKSAGTFCQDEATGQPWCLCVGGKSDAKEVGMCDPNRIPSPIQVPVLVWDFDPSNSALKITPHQGVPSFLSLITGSATLETKADYNSAVYIEQVPTNSGLDLQAVEDGIEKIKTEVMNWNNKGIKITKAKNKATKSQKIATHLLTYYTTQQKELSTMVNDATLQAESIISNANNSLTAALNLADELDQEITETIPSLPKHFHDTVRKEKLAKDLVEIISKMNSTVKEKINQHRILPETLYDYVVIVTVVCYVIYFIDLFIRVSGVTKAPGVRNGRTILEMDTCSRAGTITSHIDPEYFLHDTGPSTFEVNKERVQGKLQLRPMEN